MGKIKQYVQEHVLKHDSKGQQRNVITAISKEVPRLCKECKKENTLPGSSRGKMCKQKHAASVAVEKRLGSRRKEF